jgi:hypothetical protein
VILVVVRLHRVVFRNVQAIRVAPHQQYVIQVARKQPVEVPSKRLPGQRIRLVDRLGLVQIIIEIVDPRSQRRAVVVALVECVDGDDVPRAGKLNDKLPRLAPRIRCQACVGEAIGVVEQVVSATNGRRERIGADSVRKPPAAQLHDRKEQ